MELVITKHFLTRAEQRLYPEWSEKNPDKSLEEFFVWLNDYCVEEFGGLPEFCQSLQNVDGFSVNKGSHTYVFYMGEDSLVLKTVLKKCNRKKEKIKKVLYDDDMFTKPTVD